MAETKVSATLAPAHKTRVSFRTMLGRAHEVRMLRFDGEPGQTYQLDPAEFAVLEKRGIVVEAKAPAPPPAARAGKPAED